MNYEYRVIWKREGNRRKVKRFATLKAAERQIVTLGPEPWKARGLDPDAKRCCDGYQCGCGGLTVREEAAQYAADIPPLTEQPRIEAREIGVWTNPVPEENSKRGL